MRKLCLILLVLGVLSIDGLGGRPPPMPPPKRYDPPAREYIEEGFDAVWLLWQEETTVTADHIFYTITRALRIQTERGAERYFEVVIRYNQYWHELLIHYVRTRLPDGTVLTPPPEAVLDLPLVRERVYSDARQRVYYLPGVEPGSTVEYSYTIKARFPIPGEFQDWVIFQDWMPIRKAVYRLTLPWDWMMFLDWNVLQTNGIEELPLVFYIDGDTYVWELERVPGIEPEYRMPALEEVAPALVVSSLTSWQEVGDWWWAMVEEVLKTPDPKVEEKARAIVAGLEGKEKKAAAIYDWVIKNIKYVALEFGIGGYKPLPPGEVLANMYGDCKDSMILLLAMLRAVGIKAYPTLINVTGDVHPALPCLWFDHAIAALPVEEEVQGTRWLFLDGTAATNPYGDLPLAIQAKWALIVGIKDGDRIRHELTQTPLFPPDHNQWTIRHEITLRDDGIAVFQTSWDVQGFFARFWRYVFKALTPKQIVYFFASYANLLIPGAELIWFNIFALDDYAKPLQVTVSFAGRLGQPYAIGRMILRLPTITPVRGLVKVAWRYYPVVIGAPYVVEVGTILTLPAGWKLEAGPGDLSLEYGWGTIKAELRYTRFMGKDVVFYTVSHRIEHKEIPRWFYNEYVDAQNKYAYYADFPFLLKKH